jgi:hypothetical protein
MLGGALLSAFEKKDAEELAAIRAGHETSLLKAAQEVKQQQIEEAKTTREGLEKSREAVDERYKFYKGRKFMNAGETAHIVLSGSAAAVEAVGEGINAVAAGAHASPTGYAGGLGGWAGGPIKLDTVYSGTGAGNAGEAVARGLAIIGRLMREGASLAATLGSYERRWDDWKLQEKLAAVELGQIDKQIEAAQIREAIAQLDLDNHERQIENAIAIEEFLRGKYTNQELYTWMVREVSKIYFQCYKLAYETARRAERLYRFELGLSDSNFIQFGYWDNLRKVLLAGGRLSLDLKRMEMAHLDKNKREYELTKHISLRQLNPLSLLTLKATGTCEVTLPEWLFDLDCPGHYMRRIKNVSLSIPAVAGPYTSVNCTLLLLKSRLRKSPLLKEGEYGREGSEDDRFVDYYGTIQSVVTSTGQNDSGLFETNLRDERFLPFEGAGAESTWKLELPAEFRQFDYNTISDVILHVRYTARQGGSLLGQ